MVHLDFLPSVGRSALCNLIVSAVGIQVSPAASGICPYTPPYHAAWIADGECGVEA
ncbi:hypothetical protein NtRootD5_41060 [Arthrobacter sp. NtRootD5]|nr:hypothetical protein NtRootA2_41010 [Arthrobacter sp. NtRootA2]BCW29502.1 hypothetical protein NtRootC45_41020 [Arthrobacter sp. NtRootC45]BCW33775.1 hypothetical protein NtRootD5_41060 [Arthrobacter sp. NtRootD5]